MESYKKSALAALKEQLEKHYADISLLNLDDLESNVKTLNVYPNLKHLKDLSEDEIFVLDENRIDISKAEKAVLNGELFFEHACAGEATRLGLGTKYLINLSNLSMQKVTAIINDERYNKGKKLLSEEQVKKSCDVDTDDLANLSLGNRHMLQLSFDIKKLTDKYNVNYMEVLNRQSMLIILNENTADDIIKEFIKYNFFGFNNKKIYFMIQLSFHGIHIQDNELVYNEDNESKRLHNHGQMFMQKTHDNSIFYIDNNSNNKIFLKSNDFEEILIKHKDMVSYNIEDASYLTSSIDYPSLAKSLELSEKGYEMIMEITSQNKENPIKGGAAFYDPILVKNVMIESNRLLDLRNEEISHLNKNVNHYPIPVNSWRKVKKKGLHMCYSIKKSNGNTYLYPCPVQGDINFLVKTAFLMRKELKSIKSWKGASHTPIIIKAMSCQDKQDGFLYFVKNNFKIQL